MSIFNNAFALSINAYSNRFVMNPFMNLLSSFSAFNSPIFNFYNANVGFLNSNVSFPSAFPSFGAASLGGVAPSYQSITPPIFGLPNFNISAPTLQLNSLNTDTFTSNTSGDLGSRMLAKAKSYLGVVNSSAEGNRLFSPKGYQNTGWYRQKGRWGWCCDFAVHCAKSVIGEGKYFKDMVTSSPITLSKKAKGHNAYLQAPPGDKASWIANNAKPGDIIYMKGRGDSGKHIAIFESIKNGVVQAISGNYGGKVKEHKVNLGEIFGFVSLGRLAA